jgi:glutamate/tyrosine decarboxylase-like PLP-dependent enzyme
MRDPICRPEEIALKSLFLGPQSENATWFQKQILEVLRHTFEWRKSRFPQDGRAMSDSDQNSADFQLMQEKMTDGLRQLLQSLENETPKFTPRYIGHMVSEISLPSLLAEFAMLLHNPNNASLEASRVGLAIEKSAIADLAEMVGFNGNEARGHFTSGGTLANFEGLWRALHRFDRGLSSALASSVRGDSTAGDFFQNCHLPQARQNTSIEYSILEQGAWAIDTSRILGFRFLGPVLLVPGSKHYSWPKAAAAFGIGAGNVWSIELDDEGRLDVKDLKLKIEKARTERRPIVAVISVAGTTELGEVDPIDRVQDLIDTYKSEGISIWHHVDAAYGGFLTSINSPGEGFSHRTILALKSIGRADSVTLDPHKLGYIPYACGAFIARDSDRYKTHQVSAPYLRTTDAPAPGWATTLEGSRSAAGAAAVWLTSRTLPFNETGFGKILARTTIAKFVFAKTLAEISEVKLLNPADTNVLCFAIAKPKDTVAELNRRTHELFNLIEEGPEFSVSRTELHRSNYSRMIARHCLEWDVVDDTIANLFVIRLVLMNPFTVSKEMTTDFACHFKSTIEKHLEVVSRSQ